MITCQSCGVTRDGFPGWAETVGPCHDPGKPGRLHDWVRVVPPPRDADAYLLDAFARLQVGR